MMKAEDSFYTLHEVLNPYVLMQTKIELLSLLMKEQNMLFKNFGTVKLHINITLLVLLFSSEIKILEWIVCVQFRFCYVSPIKNICICIKCDSFTIKLVL